MNYKALHDYFKDVSANLSVSVQWVHNTPEYLQLYDKDQPIALLSLPFTSSGSAVDFITEIYVANFVFYMKDEPDGSLDQNNQGDLQQTLEILALTNQAVDEFLRLSDMNKITEELEYASDRMTIQSFTKGNAIRNNQVLTGTTLTLNISVPDDFDYCCNPNIV